MGAYNSYYSQRGSAMRREGEKKVRIKWIEFENLATGLKIERVCFNDDITLLVGLSGVGKTQILDAVEYSLKLAVNKTIRLKPYHVLLGLEIEGTIYEWEYHIQSRRDEDLMTDNEEDYYFFAEVLKEKDKILFKRDEKSIEVVGYDKIPTPKRDESLLVQYAEDDKFRFLIKEIRKLFPIEVDLNVRMGLSKEEFSVLKERVKEYIKREPDISFKVFSHLPVGMKIYIAKTYYRDLYVKIFGAVKELFMEIEDIDIVEDSYIDMHLIAISVYGKTLLQHEISNGMLKTIYYIVELFTMPDNALVLIDEFENGLGVNCIDLLSDILFSERNDLQFIITSHHPKIINGISINKWKIIDRNINVVSNIDSSQYGIGNSQHEAYFNLINRWEYEGKI